MDTSSFTLTWDQLSLPNQAPPCWQIVVSTATDSTLDANSCASKHLKAEGGENSMQKELSNYNPTLLCSSLEQE